MNRIAILASGGGSNADKIAQYFKDHSTIEVGLILTNRSKAGVIEVAKRHHIDCYYITNAQYQDQAHMLDLLNECDLIVLAGFLKLIPSFLIEAFPNKIVNIHPALLPKYGGKGMYGMHVHHAVFEAGDMVSGPTIHYVNERYDEGAIIAQFSTDISACTSPEEVANEVLKLEHKHYAEVIEQVILSKDST